MISSLLKNSKKKKKNAKFYKKINKPNQEKYIYVYTTIDKLASGDFFSKFPSLSQTDSASLLSLIN